MNGDKELVRAINACFKKNLVKTVVTQCALLVSHIAAVSVVMLLMLILPGSVMMILGIPLMFAVCALVLIFQYGFAVILYKLWTFKRAVIGDLWSGMRDVRRLGGAAALFVLIELACMLAAAALFFALGFSPDFSAAVSSADPAAQSAALPLESPLASMFILAAFFGALLLLCILPFACVWFLMYDNPRMKAREAFLSSARLLKGNKLRLIFFLVRSCGVFLALALVIYGFNAAAMLSALVTSGAESVPQTEFFTRAVTFVTAGNSGAVFSAIYYAAEFIAISKGGFALAALYASVIAGTRVPAGIEIRAGATEQGNLLEDAENRLRIPSEEASDSF
jgi:hypothetical protein